MGAYPFVAQGSFSPLNEVTAHHANDTREVLSLPGCLNEMQVTIVERIEFGDNS